MKKIVLLSILLYPLINHAQYEEPILTLNTEMHTAIIGSIDTDAEGKYVLTCSKDKTAKLWHAETGKLLHTYRPPIGLGDEGMLYAAAISPNGKYVALGGYTTAYSKKEYDIYIFERQTGTLTHRIAGLPEVIFDLEFSKDGQYLAAALGRANGIRIYRSTDWTLHFKDTKYKERCENIAFSNQGNLITASYDGHLRLYSSAFKLIEKIQTTGGEKPSSVAFSPNGKLLAIGYRDNPQIQVIDAKTLKFLYETNISGTLHFTKILDEVCFSIDGKQLIAGGSYQKKEADDNWWCQIRIWEDKGQGSYQDFPAGDNGITDIKPLSNGNILFASTQPDRGILDKHSEKKMVYKAAEINSFAAKDRSHFKINDDGSSVGLTPKYKKPLSFHIASRLLEEKEATLQSYKASAGDIKILNWDESYQPKLNGKTLSFLKEYEMCYSVDISDNKQRMVFGTNWGLYALDVGGKRWRTAAQSSVYAVNIAKNNQVVAACLSDGTISWYRMSDGALLLNLFIHPDNKRWVLWTPSGYYDVSAGAEDLIGWHVNQGADSEALYYPVRKFRHIYYRPDVIDRILETSDEAEALRLANEAAGKSNNQSRSIVEELPPTVSILSPSTSTLIATNTVELMYSVKSPNEEPITAVKIQIDGRPIEIDRGLKSKDDKFTQSIRIPSRNCTVSILAENRFGISTAASIDLIWNGAISVSGKPNLYILAIGVADYDDDAFDLNYPDDDANAFVNTLQKQEGLLYNEVISKLYVNKDATKDNILDGLDWLVKETTQYDVAMLFFAGHGIIDNRGTFYYLPVGADEAYKRRTCLMEADVQETVSNVTGKIVVFMDACHSGSLMLASNRRGNPDISRIVNELIQAENGAVVFTSSTGKQSSLEDPIWGHGAFTKALIEGLEGEAKVDNTGKTTCKSLDLYITQRVKQLTKGKQTPTTNYPPNVPDFPISIVE